MMTHGKPNMKTGGGLLLIVPLLVALLLVGCQSAPAAPTAAPKPAAPAAPTTAPAAAPTAAPAAVAPTAAAAATAPAATAKTVMVKVGFQPAYTGAVVSNSEPQSKAMYDYMQLVNDQGGVAYKDPKTGETIKAKLDVVWEDNGYDTTRALSIYQRQKAAGVKAILGHGTSMGVALADPASKDKLPVLFMGGPNDAMMKPSPRYITALANIYDWQGKSFVAWAKGQWKESRAPRLGITIADNAAGLMLVNGVADFAKKLGWEVVDQEIIKVPISDSSVEMKRLFGAKPDWIYSGMPTGDNAVALKDAVRLGFKEQAKWVAFPFGFDPATYQQVAGAETDGANGWLYNAIETETNLPGIVEAAAAAQKYRQAPLTTLYMQGFGFAKVFVLGGIKGALEKVGYDALTPEAVNNALHNMKNLDIGGIYPAVTTTDDAPFIFSKARLVQWKDKKLNVLTDWQDGSVH